MIDPFILILLSFHVLWTFSLYFFLYLDPDHLLEWVCSSPLLASNLQWYHPPLGGFGNGCSEGGRRGRV